MSGGREPWLRRKQVLLGEDNRMPSLTPADMDTSGHLGETHATLRGPVSASLTFSK